MFTHIPYILSIIYHMFLFYVLGVFLFPAVFKTCCNNDYYCYKEYLEWVKSGSISCIFLRDLMLIKDSLELYFSNFSMDTFTIKLSQGIC
ncbi:hypothetical protein A7978_04765 (plasmid) [Borrelia turicatae]|uniref:Uncharacterized protein n=2 Tax=Borrelia turicatae TaxID=142 RepID=S4VUH3_BORT9|nr:hypothetical protein [Borrelia turicatae]AGO68867.1 hypothetical protein BTA083 [Borrelia turicatae 91E135]ANF34425.1 hypothetical protein A7978_04765 [Borrelia turicatae]UPA14009.1 hypothetical protein bt91E135_001173 [Borrelia turicatae 91E135]